MMRTTNEIELWVLILCVSCAPPKTVEPEPVQFDDAPVMEPEAGPAPVIDAAVSADAAPADAGVVVVVDAAVDAGAVAPDVGSVDAGRLVEPLLADDALKARFEAALKRLTTRRQLRPSLMRSLRRRLISTLRPTMLRCVVCGAVTKRADWRSCSRCMTALGCCFTAPPRRWRGRSTMTATKRAQSRSGGRRWMRTPAP